MYSAFRVHIGEVKLVVDDPKYADCKIYLKARFDKKTIETDPTKNM